MRFIRNALLIATATYTLSGCGDKEEIKEGDDNEPGEDGGGADAPIIKLENPGSGKCSNDLGLLKRQVEEANAKEAELLQKVKALEAMTGRSESSAKPQGRLVALQEENLAKEAKLKKAELEINTIKGGLIGLKALLDGSSYQTRTGRVLVDTEIKEIKNRIKREQAKLQQVLNDKRDLEQDRARLEEQMNEQKLAIVIADEEKSKQEKEIMALKNAREELTRHVRGQITDLFKSVGSDDPESFSKEIDRIGRRQVLVRLLRGRFEDESINSLVPELSNEEMLNQLEMKLRILSRVESNDAILGLYQEMKALSDRLGNEKLADTSSRPDLDVWIGVSQLLSIYESGSSSAEDRYEALLQATASDDVREIASRIASASRNDGAEVANALHKLGLDMRLDEMIREAPTRHEIVATPQDRLDDFSLSELIYLDSQIRFIIDVTTMNVARDLVPVATRVKEVFNRIQRALAAKYLNALIDKTVTDVKLIRDDSSNQLLGNIKHLIELRFEENVRKAKEIPEQVSQISQRLVRLNEESESLSNGLLGLRSELQQSVSGQQLPVIEDQKKSAKARIAENVEAGAVLQTETALLREELADLTRIGQDLIRIYKELGDEIISRRLIARLKLILNPESPTRSSVEQRIVSFAASQPPQNAAIDAFTHVEKQLKKLNALSFRNDNLRYQKLAPLEGQPDGSGEFEAKLHQFESAINVAAIRELQAAMQDTESFSRIDPTTSPWTANDMLERLSEQHQVSEEFRNHMLIKAAFEIMNEDWPMIEELQENKYKIDEERQFLHSWKSGLLTNLNRFIGSRDGQLELQPLLKSLKMLLMSDKLSSPSFKELLEQKYSETVALMYERPLNHRSADAPLSAVDLDTLSRQLKYLKRTVSLWDRANTIESQPSFWEALELEIARQKLRNKLESSKLNESDKERILIHINAWDNQSTITLESIEEDIEESVERAQRIEKVLNVTKKDSWKAILALMHKRNRTKRDIDRLGSLSKKLRSDLNFGIRDFELLFGDTKIAAVEGLAGWLSLEYLKADFDAFLTKGPQSVPKRFLEGIKSNPEAINRISEDTALWKGSHASGQAQSFIHWLEESRIASDRLRL